MKSIALLSACLWVATVQPSLSHHTTHPLSSATGEVSLLLPINKHSDACKSLQKAVDQYTEDFNAYAAAGGETNWALEDETKVAKDKLNDALDAQAAANCENTNPNSMTYL